MTLTLQDIRTRAQQLRTRRDHLRLALDRINRAAAEADAQVAELMHDRVFARLGAEHHARTRQDIARELGQVRVPAASVALHLARQASADLAPVVQAFRAQAMRSPDPVEWFLQRTGGERLNLRDSDEILLQLLDEVRTSRLHAEMQDAPPSVVLARYTEALDSDTDEAGSMVRYVERRHGRTWAGAEVDADQEVTAATHLRRAIVEAKALRVPAELDEVSALLDDCSRVVSKATAAELYALRPVDPSTSPTFGEHHASELPAWEAEIVEAARLEQQS